MLNLAQSMLNSDWSMRLKLAELSADYRQYDSDAAAMKARDYGCSMVERPTRHILGHFGDGGVTAASARIVAAVRAHIVGGVE